MVSIENNILQNFGGLCMNDLSNIIKNNLGFIKNGTAMETYLIKSSSYYTCDTLVATLAENTERFSLLSLNCQSLNSKFDNILILVECLGQNNCYFSAICLQETWLDDDADLSLYNIPGYVCIGQGKHCSAHGGLLIYLYHTLIYDLNIIPVNSETFEGMFVKILNANGRNIYLGNIYRPPRNNNSELSIQTFLDYLNPSLENFNKLHSDVILVGDFNINLLKYNDQVGSKMFLQHMFSIGMIPNITLPTRITDSTATLIDNVFTNIQMNNNNLSRSGALISNISDHLPYFYCFS